MEKIKLNVSGALMAQGAINMMMRVPGLEAKKAYWLDRLRQKLNSSIKQYEAERKRIFDKYATEIPVSPFVPPADYDTFKHELLDSIQKDSDVNIWSVFEKFEKQSEHGGQRGVDATKKIVFEEELCALKESLEMEIEYAPIAMDDNTRAVMSRLPGELQKSLYCFFDGEVVEDPKIVLAQAVPSFPGGKLIN